MEVNGNILLIVGNPQGIFDPWVRPHPIHLLNVSIVLIYCILCFFNYFKNLKTCDAGVVLFAF
jgi:hypothetical protein